MFFEALFRDAPEGLLVEVAHGDPPVDREWLPVTDVLGRDWSAESDHTFFGPALRSSSGSRKEDCAATRCLWVDRDSEEFARATFPPSFVVWSGHGWHYYWLLTEWLTDRDAIEKANQILLEDVDGDKACWNVNRLLRVPETANEDARCELRNSEPGIVYEIGDLDVLRDLPAKTRHKIRTGDRRGYKSRSERDWAVVTELLQAGADDRLVELIFRHQPVGDKVKDTDTHASYLERTIRQASKSPVVVAAKGGFEERPDGYYVARGKTVKRVSTFRFEPELLLDGAAFGAEDALLGSVITEAHAWKEVRFTRSAFTSVRSMDRETPLMGWQWLGRDDDVRTLLPYLLEKLKAKGFPKTAAADVLGLHRHGGRYLFLGDSETLAADDYWTEANAPLVYLDTRREHPSLLLKPVETGSAELIASLVSLLPQLNEPETIWPILGWYAATPLKPALEALGIRFPILNVFGTKGSGKTTTIQRVMMPLFGQTDPRSYDANTTRFVTLSLLGSSNAIPVAFSEFRFGAADKFLRYVLLSYDTGHDPRGRADQTTIDYPLSAPFSVDGEDLIADPAAKERILAVVMHPVAVAEGSEHYDANRALAKLDLSSFAGGYLQFCLGFLDDELPQRLRSARDAVFSAFPDRLPDRVRNNLTVAFLGIQSFCEYTGLGVPDASVLSESLRSVFDIVAGRAPVAADELVEDLVNAAAGSSRSFHWEYDHDPDTFWFQLSSAYSWWTRTKRGTLGRDAIRSQLRELEYVFGPESRGHGARWMYGVNLAQAHQLGLDIPSNWDPKTLEVKF